MLQALPKEIIGHIGSFLRHKDRIKCHESAKVFADIHAGIKTHLINIKGHESWSRIKQKLFHVIRIKPYLYNVYLEFECCLDNTCDEWNDIDDVCSYIHDICPNMMFSVDMQYCKNEFIHAIVDAFQRHNICFELDVKYTTVRGKEKWLSLQNLMNITTYVTDRNVDIIKYISNVPSMFLYCHDLSSIFDISSINTNINKHLCVILSGRCGVQYIALHKATMIMIDEASILNKRTCLYMDKNETKCRIKEVLVISFDHVTQDGWLELIKRLPKTTTYRINIKNPNNIWYLDQLRYAQVNNVIYHCNSIDSLMILKLFRFCYPFHNHYPLMISRVMETEDFIRMNVVKNVDEIFNSISEYYRDQWYPLYAMYKQTHNTPIK